MNTIGISVISNRTHITLLAEDILYLSLSGRKTVIHVTGNRIYETYTPILVGMGCRYLLEFGEVSNTYNFTVPNMIVHVLLINILCLACWYLAAKMPQKGIR